MPFECCGFLIGRCVGDAHHVTRIIPSENVYSGDRTRRYEIDPQLTFDIIRETGKTGEAVVGFYHSHPTDHASPSRRDVASAWPGKSYLIVGAVDCVEGGSHGLDGCGHVDVRSWRVCAESNLMHEEALEIDRESPCMLAYGVFTPGVLDSTGLVTRETNAWRYAGLVLMTTPGFRRDTWMRNQHRPRSVQ